MPVDQSMQLWSGKIRHPLKIRHSASLGAKINIRHYLIFGETVCVARLMASHIPSQGSKELVFACSKQLGVILLLPLVYVALQFPLGEQRTPLGDVQKTPPGDPEKIPPEDQGRSPLSPSKHLVFKRILTLYMEAPSCLLTSIPVCFVPFFNYVNAWLPPHLDIVNFSD
uniref:Uncharacterized protein n=1 Tax=Sphaerodactylus townsendi TaxID=933632 RepID=A0ACB8ES85_9SAUR